MPRKMTVRDLAKKLINEKHQDAVVYVSCPGDKIARPVKIADSNMSPDFILIMTREVPN